MTANDPTDEQICTVLRAHLIQARLHCPGGTLMPEDLRGTIKTVANITGADVPRVMALALLDEAAR